MVSIAKEKCCVCGKEIGQRVDCFYVMGKGYFHEKCRKEIKS